MDFKVIITINDKNANLYRALFTKAYQALEQAGKLKDEFKNEEGRFLNLDDYFAHMSDLLALDIVYMMLPLDEASFTINANTRVIATPKIVTLQNDQIAETVVFTIDRFFDYMDLNNATIYVQWTLPSGKEGATEIEMKDILTEPGKIRFGWPLDSEVTSEIGQVKYSIRFWNKGVFKEEDGDVEKVVYSFNTLTSSLTISPSLQPEINPDVDINAPVKSSLFSKAIRNSQSTSYPIPLSPTFGEPGLDLPLCASLEENALTLKAQAVVGDTGTISYEWYYKPAENITVEGKSFSNEVFYPYNEDSENGINGFSVFGGVVNNNAFEEVIFEEGQTELLSNEVYYTLNEEVTPYAYEVYTGTSVPTNGTKLYQRFTTYTIPLGDVKVSGEYIVKAVNRISASNVNVSNPESSSVCCLVSPADIEIITNLEENVLLSASGEDTLLKISIKAPKDENTVIGYDWKKNILASDVASEDWNSLETQNGTYAYVNEPGWYSVNVTSTLNREEKSAVSNVCKVTYEPKLPAMEYSEDAKSKIEEGDTIPTYGGITALLEVVHPYGVFANEEDYITYGSTYSNQLFSEQLEYVWAVKLDGVERVLTQDDINSGLINELGKNTIQFNTETGNVLYEVICYVSNILNGKKITSDRTNSLVFYVK